MTGAPALWPHLVEALLQRSYQVRVLDNLFTGQMEILPQHDNLEFIKGDITDYTTCQAAMRDVDGVFHMAAMNKVLPSLANPEMIDFCAAQIAAGTANVLKAALERKDRVRKVIYSGSSTYYGAGPVPDCEDTRHDCQTPYALTKYVGETYCELFSRLHRLPTIRLRYFMVYGPRQPSSGPYAIVTGVFMNAWMRGEPLTILGTGHQTRDFIHVSEIAEANIRAFESTVADATINVGTGRAISILELANIFSDKLIYLPPRVRTSRILLRMSPAYASCWDGFRTPMSSITSRTRSEDSPWRRRISTPNPLGFATKRRPARRRSCLRPTTHRSASASSCRPTTAAKPCARR